MHIWRERKRNEYQRFPCDYWRRGDYSRCSCATPLCLTCASETRGISQGCVVPAVCSAGYSARILGNCKSSPSLALPLRERSNATFRLGVNMEISYAPAASFYRLSKKQALSFLQDNSFLGCRILRSITVFREMIISLTQFPRVSELIFLIADEWF